MWSGICLSWAFNVEQASKDHSDGTKHFKKQLKTYLFIEAYSSPVCHVWIEAYSSPVCHVWKLSCEKHSLFTVGLKNLATKQKKTCQLYYNCFLRGWKTLWCFQVYLRREETLQLSTLCRETRLKSIKKRIILALKDISLFVWLLPDFSFFIGHYTS